MKCVIHYFILSGAQLLHSIGGSGFGFVNLKPKLLQHTDTPKARSASVQACRLLKKIPVLESIQEEIDNWN